VDTKKSCLLFAYAVPNQVIDDLWLSCIPRHQLGFCRNFAAKLTLVGGSMMIGRSIMKTFWAVIAGMGLSLALGASAEAATRVGVLKCYVAGGPSFIVGSSHEARCVFKSDVSGRTEHYVARVRRVGIDVGYTGKALIVWAVYAPSVLHHHALAGSYVGASADVAASIGGGANVLVGGNDATVSLQPLSLKSESGWVVAAGAGDLELR
jgi:hypothetical protein